MNLFYLLALILAGLVFFLNRRRSLTLRFILAILTFVILAAAVTLIVVKIGDRPGEGFREYSQEELRRIANSAGEGTEDTTAATEEPENRNVVEEDPHE